jgi:hypothetical protein
MEMVSKCIFCQGLHVLKLLIIISDIQNSKLKNTLLLVLLAHILHQLFKYLIMNVYMKHTGTTIITGK